MMFKKMKNLNKQKGITLVALIITIIVLIILAGVTISIALGQNGIFKKSQKVAEENSHQSLKEQLELAISDYQLEKAQNKNYNETIIDFLGEEGYLEGYKKGEENDIYIISKEKTKGLTTGKGTSKETGDVYVIEKESNEIASIVKIASTETTNVTKIAEEKTQKQNWILKYYKTITESIELVKFTSDTKTNDKDTISFTINNITCKAEKDMSFKDWFKSDYCSEQLIPTILNDGSYTKPSLNDVLEYIDNSSYIDRICEIVFSTEDGFSGNEYYYFAEPTNINTIIKENENYIITSIYEI